MTRWSRKATWIGGSFAVFAATATVVAVPALAHHIKNVTIQGQPVVGSTLTAVVVLNEPTATLEYRWQRCAGVEKNTCARILAAPDAASYTVSGGDVGQRLAVRVISVAAGDQDSEWSPRTGVVTTPPAPEPTPTPTPTPTPGSTPGPDPDPDPPSDAPTFNQSKGPALLPPVAGPAAPTDQALSYMRPFPVVRVKGTLVRGGARISLLRIKAPEAASVDVRCKGPGCRVRKRSFGSGRVEALERFLRAGTRITIRVSKEGSVGKYVRLVIRDGSAPKRRDACLLARDAAPAGCPEA